MKKIFLSIICLMLFFGCTIFEKKEVVFLEPGEIDAATKLDMPLEKAGQLKEKKLYEFTPKEMNDYLPLAWEICPDFHERIVHFARKGLGQPYHIYLLGEFPFEIYDSDPLFCLEKSDCMVFTEHIYAMALSKDWPQFFSLLQRIRYIGGEISTTTRNHSSIPLWVDNNSWLLRDITEEIAPELTKPFTFTYNPNRELINDYGLDPGFPTQKIDRSYIPLKNIPQIASRLQNGDYVCVIRGFSEKGLWSGHVGFITKSNDGTVNFLDSAGSGVKETPLLECVEKSLSRNKQREEFNKWVDKAKKDKSLQKPKRKFLFFKKKAPRLRKKYYHYGYKFYRPYPDPWKRLIEIDGEDAPVVTGPRGLLLNRKDIPVKKKSED